MKKRKLRTILMAMLITVFTTTSVFAINTANFKPYHNSQPITGAGKTKYKQSAPNGGSGFFAGWDSKNKCIIPATGINVRYTDQAKRASGAYSARTKGTASGLSYYGTGQTSPLKVLKTNKWYNFLTDKNSGNNVQVHYYHNKIYDPVDTRADENGYVHFTTRTTLRAWNHGKSTYKRIRASGDGKKYATKAKMQKDVPLRGLLRLSRKANGGIPFVIVVGDLIKKTGCTSIRFNPRYAVPAFASYVRRANIARLRGSAPTPDIHTIHVAPTKGIPLTIIDRPIGFRQSYDFFARIDWLHGFITFDRTVSFSIRHLVITQIKARRLRRTSMFAT